VGSTEAITIVVLVLLAGASDDGRGYDPGGGVMGLAFNKLAN
jgi:hypothetical protein